MKKFLKDISFLVDFVKKAAETSKMINADTLKVIEKNEHYKAKLGWTYDEVMKALGSKEHVDVGTREFSLLVVEFQKGNGMTPDGILGPATYDAILESGLTKADQAVKKVFDLVMAHESGGDYAAMNRDGEFKGLFDKTWIRRTGKPHPASGKIHIGLSFGIIQFTQDGGSLGKLLKRCYDKNPNKFKQIMGETYEQLLNIVTESGPSGLSSGRPRGARVQPVPIRLSWSAGSLSLVDIWEDPWVSKFKQLGNDPEFQAVQRELALDEYLKPVLPFLKERGLLSEKMVACALDGCVHRGVGGFRTLIRNSKATSEKGTLEYLKGVNDRFARIVNNKSLTVDKWEGWSNYE